MINERIVDGPFEEEVPPEEDAKITAMIEQAERDIREVRVSMRWLKPQVDVIKRAAALYGIPYQTYVKHAAFRQALADLEAVKSVGARPKR